MSHNKKLTEELKLRAVLVYKNNKNEVHVLAGDPKDKKKPLQHCVYNLESKELIRKDIFRAPFNYDRKYYIYAIEASAVLGLTAGLWGWEIKSAFDIIVQYGVITFSPLIGVIAYQIKSDKKFQKFDNWNSLVEEFEKTSPHANQKSLEAMINKLGLDLYKKI